MKVTITYELSDEAYKLIRECSIERVINESVRIIEENTNEGVSENSDADNNLSDWDSCKRTVVALWDAMRDAGFRDKHDMKQVNDWIV